MVLVTKKVAQVKKRRTGAERAGVRAWPHIEHSSQQSVSRRVWLAEYNDCECRQVFSAVTGDNCSVASDAVYFTSISAEHAGSILTLLWGREKGGNAFLETWGGGRRHCLPCVSLHRIVPSCSLCHYPLLGDLKC